MGLVPDVLNVELQGLVVDVGVVRMVEDGVAQDGTHVGRTARDLVEFIHLAQATAILNESSAGQYRSSVRKVFEAVNGEGWEDVDLGGVDVEDYLVRFERLSAHRYKSVTLKNYESRFRSALGLFQEHQVVRTRMFDYRYPLRPQLMVHLRLPMDLSRDEAERLVMFLGLLPVERGRGPGRRRSSSRTRGVL